MKKCTTYETRALRVSGMISRHDLPILVSAFNAEADTPLKKLILKQIRKVTGAEDAKALQIILRPFVFIQKDEIEQILKWQVE